MPLRLPRWLRRTPAPQGRHVRTAAPVSAPGAAATLVSATVEPYLMAAPPSPAPAPVAPSVPAVDLRPPEPAPVTEGDVGTVTEPMPPVLAPTETPAVPPEAAELAAPAPAEIAQAAEPAEPTVGLGFADGGVLELAPDDPRLAGFHDAAAAVLGHERA